MLNIKRGGESMVQGLIFLKGEPSHFSYLILSMFIIFTLINYSAKSSSAAGHSQHQPTSVVNI